MIRIAALAVEIIRGGQPERVKRDLKDIQKHGARAGHSMISLKTVLQAVGMGFAIKGVLTGLRFLTTSALDFGDAMTKSLAIMGDVSGAMRNKMEEAAKAVARSTTFSATEAAEAYFYLASAGLDARQSIAAMPQVAKFAQAGAFDLARATDLATDAQSALGWTVNDAAENLENLTRVTDVLVKANTLANATVEQFSESLTRKAGAALKIVNKDIEEGVAVLAAFANQGIKGAEAGTALNIVMRDLTTKAIRNNMEFGALGIAVYDSNENMRNMADIIGDLEGALEGMSDKQKKATLLQLGFTDRSVSFIQAILGESEAIRRFEEQLRNAGGTVDEVANKQLESFKAQLVLTRDTLQSMIITLVNIVGPMLGFEEGLVDVREALEDFEQSIKDSEEAIGKWVNGIVVSVNLAIQIFKLLVMSFVNAFVQIGNFVGNLSVMIFGVFNLLRNALGNLAAMIWGVFKGIIGAIRPIGALIRAIFTHDLEGVKTAFEDLKEGMTSGFGLIGTAGKEFAADLKADYGLIGTAGKELVAGFVADGQVIRDQVTASADAVLALWEVMRGGDAAPRRTQGGPKGAGVPSVPGLASGTYGGDLVDISSLRLPDPNKIALMQLPFFRTVTQETLDMIDEMGGLIESGIEETIGDAIFNGLQVAFETGNLLSFFAEFGKTLLAGFGDIMVQLGKILIQYGLTMEALRPFLMNIFTAGPAAIAAGAALIALGSTFTSIVSSGGGAGRGMGTAGAFREQTFGFAQQSADVSRTTISMGSAQTVQPQPAPIFYNVFIGPDDPSVQRQMAELMMNATRRGFRFT